MYKIYFFTVYIYKCRYYAFTPSFGWNSRNIPLLKPWFTHPVHTSTAITLLVVWLADWGVFLQCTVNLVGDSFVASSFKWLVSVLSLGKTAQNPWERYWKKPSQSPITESRTWARGWRWDIHVDQLGRQGQRSMFLTDKANKGEL